MLKDFKAFIMRGNVVDLAVGIIIGAAFTGVVTSLVNDLLMPPIGLLLGNLDFSSLFAVLKTGATPGPYMTPAEAKAAGAVTLNYGLFINTLVSFLITGFAVYLLVRGINRLHAKQQTAPEKLPTTKQCPYCLETVPLQATRCGHCTSQIPAGA